MNNVKVSKLIEILNDALHSCATSNRFEEGIAGQILAYKTELEVFYPNPDKSYVSLSETIVNLLAKANDIK